MSCGVVCAACTELSACIASGDAAAGMNGNLIDDESGGHAPPLCSVRPRRHLQHALRHGTSTLFAAHHALADAQHHTHAVQNWCLQMDALPWQDYTLECFNGKVCSWVAC